MNEKKRGSFLYTDNRTLGYNTPHSKNKPDRIITHTYKQQQLLRPQS